MSSTPAQTPADTAGMWAVYVATLVCGGAMLYASYDALCGLALYTGWAPRVAPALPLSVDALGIAAGYHWARGPEGDPATAYARRITITSVVASSAGNVVYHVLVAPPEGAAIAVIVSVALWPSIGAALLLHLLALLGATRPAPVATPVAPIAAAPVAAPPAPVAAAPVAPVAPLAVALPAQAQPPRPTATVTLPERNAEVHTLGSETKSQVAARVLLDFYETHGEILDRHTLKNRVEAEKGTCGLRTIDAAIAAFREELAS